MGVLEPLGTEVDCPGKDKKPILNKWRDKMASDYEVVLEFNCPPEDIRRQANTLREIDRNLPGVSDQTKYDIQYSADVMDEIANKMEE